MSAIRAESATPVRAAILVQVAATKRGTRAAPVMVPIVILAIRAIPAAVMKMATSSAAPLATIPAGLLMVVMRAALSGAEKRALPATGVVSAAVRMVEISAHRIPAGTGASARPTRAGMGMQIHPTTEAAGRI